MKITIKYLLSPFFYAIIHSYKTIVFVFFPFLIFNIVHPKYCQRYKKR